MDHPLGAGSNRGDQVDFDRRVRREFRGADRFRWRPPGDARA